MCERSFLPALPGVWASDMAGSCRWLDLPSVAALPSQVRVEVPAIVAPAVISEARHGLQLIASATSTRVALASQVRHAASWPLILSLSLSIFPACAADGEALACCWSADLRRKEELLFLFLFFFSVFGRRGFVLLLPLPGQERKAAVRCDQRGAGPSGCRPCVAISGVQHRVRRGEAAKLRRELEGQRKPRADAAKGGAKAEKVEVVEVVEATTCWRV